MGRTRVLAVDPGTRRIGIALSSPEGTMALPLQVIEAGPSAVPGIVALAKEYEAGEVVVGLPKRLDGSEGPAAAQARELADELRRHLDVTVHLLDERLTTAAADRALREAGAGGRRRRQTVDRSAAAMLLQSYLDRRPQ